MKYISTRGKSDALSFSDAIMTGLSRDGGLFLPESFPQISSKLDEWQSLSYSEIAFEVMRLFTDLPEDDLRNIIVKSYSTFSDADITPIKRVGDVYIMELFHGPTMAFKDIALQFLGNLFEYELELRKEHMNIVAATSGDTGSAAIQGVRGKERINIFVMHPDGRTSEVQKLQMTSVLDNNVFNLAVDGTFDDCQAVLKQLFNDLEFKDQYHLGAVNSINWARVLAQVVYYIYASIKTCKATGANKIRFSVPTGNFGDIFAGYVASRMGAPISRLTLATNENDILSRFFNSGEYSKGNVVPTISPSMDIQIASNFERYLYYLLDEDSLAVEKEMQSFAKGNSIKVALKNGVVDPLFSAGSCTTEMTLEAINSCYESYGYLLDPHTATGYRIAQDNMHDDEPMVCLATAHPAKFGDAIKQALGKDVAHHPELDALTNKPTRCDNIAADVEELKQYVKARV